MRAYDLEAIDLNANSLDAANSRTDPLSMGDARQVGMFVNAKTGSHSNHIFTLQISGDQAATWEDTTHTITGVGHLENVEVICTHIRAKCTTAEGSASEVDVFLVIK